MLYQTVDIDITGGIYAGSWTFSRSLPMEIINNAPVYKLDSQYQILFDLETWGGWVYVDRALYDIDPSDILAYYNFSRYSFPLGEEWTVVNGDMTSISSSTTLLIENENCISLFWGEFDGTDVYQSGFKEIRTATRGGTSEGKSYYKFKIWNSYEWRWDDYRIRWRSALGRWEIVAPLGVVVATNSNDTTIPVFESNWSVLGSYFPMINLKTFQDDCLDCCFRVNLSISPESSRFPITYVSRSMSISNCYGFQENGFPIFREFLLYFGVQSWVEIYLIEDEGSGLYFSINKIDNKDADWSFHDGYSTLYDSSNLGFNDAYLLDYTPCPKGVLLPEGNIEGFNWSYKLTAEWEDEKVTGIGVQNGTCGFPVDPPSPKCEDIEDRTKKEFDSVKLPVIFSEENRGWKGCPCVPMLVLGSSGKSYENDKTSAWIKLSSSDDTITFQLKKCGVNTNYEITNRPIVKEPNGWFGTINWNDVLISDGIGCYSLHVIADISGIEFDFIWGMYDLKPYTIENASGTARLRAMFNLRHSIEGINFTDSNVEDCVRFNGFIGERQPNMEIDNLTYRNREVKSVVRENLNEYKITTDPSLECITKRLLDLYLLSENELFVTDHNAGNHSYRYLDLPVIVQNSPEMNYIDIQQRLAILSCIVGDKVKNQRTFY